MGVSRELLGEYRPRYIGSTRYVVSDLDDIVGPSKRAWENKKAV